MKKFIPREKLSKKARRALDNEGRAGWDFSPVTRRVESRKAYNRKRIPRARWDDSGAGSFLSAGAEARAVDCRGRADMV